MFLYRCSYEKGIFASFHSRERAGRSRNSMNRNTNKVQERGKNVIVIFEAELLPEKLGVEMVGA